MSKKLLILLLIAFLISSCQANETLNKGKEFQGYFDMVIKELNSSWSIDNLEDDSYKYYVILSSPAESLENRSFCFFNRVQLRKDSSGKLVDLNRQLLVANIDHYYYFNKGNENCADISKEVYFFTEDLERSNKVDYRLLNVGKYFSLRSWEKDEDVQVHFRNKLGRECFSKDLVIDAVIEKQADDDSEDFLVKAVCDDKENKRELDLLFSRSFSNKIISISVFGYPNLVQ